jgi:hypothetical protein
MKKLKFLKHTRGIKFELYRNSKLKSIAEEQGKSLYFHDLNDMVCDIMRNNNIPVADALRDRCVSFLGNRRCC